jgi:hypothetical protein
MERYKRSKFLSVYHEYGFAFTFVKCYSLGQLGPDFLQFLWDLADHAVRNQFPVDLRDL